MARSLPTNKQPVKNKILVTVECTFPDGIVVSHIDKDGNQLRGALLPCQQRHLAVDTADTSRAMSRSCDNFKGSQLTIIRSASNQHLVPYGTVCHDHTYSGCDFIEDVTVFPPKSYFAGIPSREIRTVAMLPANDPCYHRATILCDRPVVPPTWLLLPEETSINSKHRKAKTNARLKIRTPKVRRAAQELTPAKRSKLHKDKVKRTTKNSLNNNYTSPKHRRGSANNVALYRKKLKRLSIDLTKIQVPDKEVAVPGKDVLRVPGEDAFGVPGKDVLRVPGEYAFGVPGKDVLRVPGEYAFGVPGEDVLRVPGEDALGEDAFGVPGEDVVWIPGEDVIVKVEQNLTSAAEVILQYSN